VLLNVDTLVQQLSVEKCERIYFFPSQVLPQGRFYDIGRLRNE